jgi:O-antigen ligase
VYSPNPAFSLAWAFKLGLVAVVIHVCSREMTEIEDMRKFLYVTIFGFVFLTVLPTLRSLFEADPLGDYGSRDLEQRFREAPTELSAIAGLLVILCLMVYSRGRRRWPLAIAALAFFLMVVAGGKTGIVAGFISGLLFYALQRRVKAALGFAAVMLIAMVLALEFTPLAAYMQNYSRLEQFSSFTGRTGLWQFVLPFVLQKPILGHGFNSSRFVAVIHPDTPFTSAHMHNSLIEAAYNNGAIGLGLVLMILFVIARNLYRVIHGSAPEEVRYLAVGGMAALVNLFINGMFNSTFGGRPDASYMMLIALVVISSHLLQMSKNVRESRTLAASV